MRLPQLRWRRVLLVVLALALAYPVAANLFLAFGGVQSIFADTQTVKVDFRRAWSLWPGRVHVSNIRVTLQDRNVQFELLIPHVDVTVRLRDLLRHTFHATRVRGSGVVFHFRHRISPDSADRPFVRDLPSIPGFLDPPLYEDTPPSPPLDDAHYNLWTVHIEDVDVGVQDLWIQMLRYQGSGRALGAFRLVPARRVWVGPAELHLEGGRIDRGARQLADVASGNVSWKLDDVDVRSVHGLDIFHFVSADANLKTDKLVLADDTPCPWMESHAATLHGFVRGEPEGPVEVEVGGEFDRASLKWGTFHLTAAHATLKNAWADGHLSTAFDASRLRLQSGGYKAVVRSALVRTDLQGTEGGLRGPTRFEAKDISAEVGSASLQGDLVASLDLGLQEPDYRVANASGKIEVRQVAVRAGTNEVNDWWANLELRKTRLDTRRNFDLKGDIVARFKDAVPALYVLVAKEQIPKWTAHVLPTQSLELDMHLERFCRWTDVTLAEPSDGRFRVSGRVQVAPSASQGALLFRLSGFPPLSLGLQFNGNDSDTSLFAGHGWLDKHLPPLAKAAADKRAARCSPEPTSCL